MITASMVLLGLGIVAFVTLTIVWVGNSRQDRHRAIASMTNIHPEHALAWVIIGVGMIGFLSTSGNVALIALWVIITILWILDLNEHFAWVSIVDDNEEKIGSSLILLRKSRAEVVYSSLGHPEVGETLDYEKEKV